MKQTIPAQKTIAKVFKYLNTVKFMDSATMPMEYQRQALILFEQLAVRGVTPDKAADTVGCVMLGMHYQRGEGRPSL